MFSLQNWQDYEPVLPRFKTDESEKLWSCSPTPWRKGPVVPPALPLCPYNLILIGNSTHIVYTRPSFPRLCNETRTLGQYCSCRLFLMGAAARQPMHTGFYEVEKIDSRGV